MADKTKSPAQERRDLYSDFVQAVSSNPQALVPLLRDEGTGFYKIVQDAPDSFGVIHPKLTLTEEGARLAKRATEIAGATINPGTNLSLYARYLPEWQDAIMQAATEQSSRLSGMFNAGKATQEGVLKGISATKKALSDIYSKASEYVSSVISSDTYSSSAEKALSAFDAKAASAIEKAQGALSKLEPGSEQYKKLEASISSVASKARAYLEKASSIVSKIKASFASEAEALGDSAATIQNYAKQADLLQDEVPSDPTTGYAISVIGKLEGLKDSAKARLERVKDAVGGAVSSAKKKAEKIYGELRSLGDGYSTLAPVMAYAK